MPIPFWGSTISDGVGQLRSYPHIMISPAIALSSGILSVIAVSDGLRDAVDPWVQR